MSVEHTADKQSSWLVVVIIIIAVLLASLWFLNNKSEEPAPEIKEIVTEPLVEAPELVAEPLATEPQVITQPEVIEAPQVTPAIELPSLNKSDAFVFEKLPTVIWRKELLKLVINEDIIRRFVVFTDNFNQGNLAYEHSPFVRLQDKFSVDTQAIANSDEVKIYWNDANIRRFSLYIDLLRSLDNDELVKLYFDIKPLLDQAYSELGYPQTDFTQVLLAAINRVLDLEYPKEQPELVRPSVMYKYKDANLEALDDSDKLLIRLGKENLLIIKSILLDISDKLSRENINQ